MSEKIKTQEEHDIEDLEEMMEVIPFSKLELKVIERAIEALGKQVPKKTIKTGMEFKALDADTKEVVMYECSPCPSCEKWITKLYKYCPHCGQRIEE